MFRSLPIGRRPMLVYLDVARVRCAKCGVTRQVSVPFADGKRQHTRAFARYALELTHHMTIKDVANHLGVGWDLVKDLKKEYLERHFRQPRLRHLKRLAIDEIHIGRGYQFRTLVFDLDTGAIVFVGKGKGVEALEPFWKRLKSSRAKIHAVAADLSPAYTKAVAENLLTDRAYIGEIRHKGQWHQGTHEPIVDRATWDRVQKLLGQGLYRSHQMTYASELIECGHCGCPITGESKTKKTKSGDREYVYYRCMQYHKGLHPRTRLTEGELDAQMLALFDKLRVEDAEFRDTFREQLRKATNWDERSSAANAKRLQDELLQVRDHQNRLLNLRLLEEIEAETYAMKAQELRDRESELKLQIDSADRNRHEIIDTAIKAFELSRNLRAKWFAADWAAKRRILEILCLNWKLDGVTLVPEMRKPFDMLAEGLLRKDSRGDWI